MVNDWESLDGDWREIAPRAAALRDAGWGHRLTYSPKVFIPLTQLCRNVCHYCTFTKPPSRLESLYLPVDEALAIARAGAAAGCREALFTLGDRPETRFREAKEALAAMGFESTLDYLVTVAKRVLAETGLLPHFNVGLLDEAEYRALRPFAPSFGIMLETASDRLSEKGGPHYGSPDKVPARRFEAIRMAGECRIPMTSGILIGIGETRAERIEALTALKDLHDRYGHIQEIIVQNFRAKPGTKMAGAPEPSLDELCWTIAVARIIFGPQMSIQVPPNLSEPDDLGSLIDAGINDWGGISPVTLDHVNPEAPWPEIETLAELSSRHGRILLPRLTVYPRYIIDRKEWIDRALHKAVLRHCDVDHLARSGSWIAGDNDEIEDAPAILKKGDSFPSARVADLVEQAVAGERLSEDDVVTLFTARGADFTHLVARADEVRREVAGDTISFVVNRNINYTNVCRHTCTFCAFSKGSGESRDAAYTVDLPELGRRVSEAWDRGATEVCLQGGIHPSYDGRTYLGIVKAAKAARPDIHVHAFSPLEIHNGATSLGLSLERYLGELRDAGLGTLPGTAAEILDDEVRAIICPDKVTTDQWLDVIRTAHGVGLKTTATIMFGHIEQPKHWARHLLRIADLQAETGGITEFVPLPFVHREAPMYNREGSRMGPTLREAILMHAVPRLLFARLIPNIQTSWVKMGIDGVRLCLNAGANDLGGTLMNESISRAAGAATGQEFDPHRMHELAASIGRLAKQRTTLYAAVDDDRTSAAFSALPLTAPRYHAGARLPEQASA